MDILQRHKDITHLSNYKTPAKAEFYYEITSRSQLEELRNVISWAKNKSKPILWVSGGTNMLFAFDEYKGVVIKNSLLGWKYNKDTKTLDTYGAEMIWDIAQKLEINYDQDIWHRFIGLPGSIAGAIYGNAGCFGLETQNNFLDCEVMNLDTSKICLYRKDDMNFRYRDSLLKQKKNFFLISARFDLSKKREKYTSDVDNIDFRKNKQPKGNSCGSFFKNPSRDLPAGYIIESIGLKGYHLGGAYFSDKHANFLMHDGNGTHNDLLSLIKLAQERSLKNFGIKLENEVQIITNENICHKK